MVSRERTPFSSLGEETQADRTKRLNGAISELDLLHAYFADATGSAYARLTCAQEQLLGKAMKGHALTDNQSKELEVLLADCETARERFIKANIGFVVKVAKKYVSSGVLLDELVAMGNIGLLVATDKFDYSRGNRFSTMAGDWIKTAITRNLPDYHRAVRLPENRIEEIRYVWTVEDKLIRALQRLPSYQEIADAINADTSRGVFVVVKADEVVKRNRQKKAELTRSDLGIVTEETVEDVYVDMQFIISTDEDELGIEGEVEKEFPDLESLTVEAEVARLALRDILEECMSILSSEEQFVVRAYYFGIDDKGPLIYDEIGALLEKTGEMARLINKRARSKMKKYASNSGLAQDVFELLEMYDERSSEKTML